MKHIHCSKCYRTCPKHTSSSSNSTYIIHIHRETNNTIYIFLPLVYSIPIHLCIPRPNYTRANIRMSPYPYYHISLSFSLFPSLNFTLDYPLTLNGLNLRFIIGYMELCKSRMADGWIEIVGFLVTD